MRTRQLMSSAQWHDTRHVGGILSPDPEENQYWWNANHVLIPYCSSDAWSGSTNGKTEAGYAFMGSLIVQEVILELLDRGLYEAKMLLLAGSSAGGAGVLLNVDRVADLLGSLGSRVKVRGVADSGWFLDNEPFEPRECLEPHSCAPLEVIKRGMKLWQGQVPERCKPTYPEDEQWRCYFGYRIYPTLRAPTFVFQWLFDEAQMTVDNVAAPSSKAQWDYIHSMGSKLRSTLSNVTNWQSVQICGISLPQALRCWELQRHEHNHHEHHPRHHLYDRLPTRDNETNSPPSMVADMSLPAFPLVTAPHEARSKRRKGKRRRKNCKHRHRRKGSNRNNARRASAAATAAAAAAALADRRGRQSSPRPDSRHVQHRWRLHEDLCKHWLMDSCTWPQCNRHCPRMLNPLTGQEVDFLDLLRSFGLDMAAVALALGVDQKALGAMDHDTLLQLLTQHAV
ncbi:hypothetical protein HPB47_013460 [Ixodes persulcatus]|uniref:Uncharacterized protein n=1 Tax=Ixodes persulcatus TaxID=34615 RepID=A0AC60QYQ5_IXOPE|nr:hypothetical protein HPB47_013460 [Ixodes persulcatus]